MKKSIFILSLILIQCSLLSQELLNKYKSGSIKLVPDQEYAAGNDWENVFRSYYDTIYGSPMGSRKSLVILKDGSVIVNHRYRDYHSKFDPSGKFVKEFSVEKGGDKAIKGVLNDNILFTELDNRGIMTCSDLDGNFKKTLLLDYMAKDIIPLNHEKFAVVGWVLWEEKTRTFVSIVDYNTNEENVIWDHFTGRSISSSGKVLSKRKPYTYSVELENGSVASTSSMQISKGSGKYIPPRITVINNDLIVALPNSGEILVYDFNGKQKSKEKVDWEKSLISIQEQKEIQEKAIQRYKEYLEREDSIVVANKEAFEKILTDMEEDLENIDGPIEKPYFSNVIKDSDGNVLFFEIPKEKDANRFHVWVFNTSGRFEAECTFVCDEYDLNINPSKMLFHNGYIYGLQTLKEAKGNPLRLVRFKLESE